MLVVNGIILSFAFLRYIRSTSRSNEKRDVVYEQLIDVFKSTKQALVTMGEKVDNTASIVNRTDRRTQMSEQVQRRTMIPALVSIYRKLQNVESKLDSCNNNELRNDLRDLRNELLHELRKISENKK